MKDLVLRLSKVTILIIFVLMQILPSQQTFGDQHHNDKALKRLNRSTLYTFGSPYIIASSNSDAFQNINQEAINMQALLESVSSTPEETEDSTDEIKLKGPKGSGRAVETEAEEFEVAEEEQDEELPGEEPDRLPQGIIDDLNGRRGEITIDRQEFIDGQWIVVWREKRMDYENDIEDNYAYALYLQLYDREGNEVGEEHRLTDNRVVKYAFVQKIKRLLNENITVAWNETAMNDLDSYRLQVFTGSGMRAHPDEHVLTKDRTVRSGYMDNIVIFPNGKIAVLWQESEDNLTNGYYSANTHPRMRFFNEDGSVTNDTEYSFSEYSGSGNYTSRPDRIITLANGNIAVTWTENTADVTGASPQYRQYIGIQFFDPSGAISEAKYKLADDRELYQLFIRDVAHLPSGDVAIIWRETLPKAHKDELGRYSLRMQVFTQIGERKAEEHLLAEEMGTAELSEVTVLPSGHIVVSWMDVELYQYYNSYYTRYYDWPYGWRYTWQYDLYQTYKNNRTFFLKTQFFTPDGEKRGNVHVHSETGLILHKLYHSKILPNGNVAVIWEEIDKNSRYSIKMQIFDPEDETLGDEIDPTSEIDITENEPRGVRYGIIEFIKNLPDGKIAIAWREENSRAISLRVQFLDQNGAKLGGEQLLLSYYNAPHTSIHSITRLSDGDIAVIWRTEYSDERDCLYMQLFSQSEEGMEKIGTAHELLYARRLPGMARSYTVYYIYGRYNFIRPPLCNSEGDTNTNYMRIVPTLSNGNFAMIWVQAENSEGNNWWDKEKTLRVKYFDKYGDGIQDENGLEKEYILADDEAIDMININYVETFENGNVGVVWSETDYESEDWALDYVNTKTSHKMQLFDEDGTQIGDRHDIIEDTIGFQYEIESVDFLSDGTLGILFRSFNWFEWGYIDSSEFEGYESGETDLLFQDLYGETGSPDEYTPYRVGDDGESVSWNAPSTVTYVPPPPTIEDRPETNRRTSNPLRRNGLNSNLPDYLKNTRPTSRSGENGGTDNAPTSGLGENPIFADGDIVTPDLRILQDRLRDSLSSHSRIDNLETATEEEALENAIRLLEEKEDKTELEEDLIEMYKNLKRDDDLIDEELKEALEGLIRETINLLNMAEAIEGMVDAEFIDSIERAFGELIKEQKNLYSSYLESTENIYTILAKLMGLKANEELRTNRYLSISAKRAMMKISVERELKKLLLKDEKYLTEAQKEALTAYSATYKPLLQSHKAAYREALESLLGRFMFNIKKTIIDVKAATNTKDGGRLFRAFFALSGTVN